MIEKNRRPQLHEDQKQPTKGTGLDMNEKGADSNANIHDQPTLDENQRGQENTGRSGEKFSGTGEQTLGIP